MEVVVSNEIQIVLYMFLYLIHTLKQGGSSKNLVTCIIQENQFQVVC